MWPTFAEPQLLTRLALDDDEFLAFVERLVTRFGPQPFDEDVYAQAIGYPGARPPVSCVLDGERVEPIRALPEGLQEAEPRYPLLAIGSNGAPQTLVRKFAMLDVDRRLVVVAGVLHDFDIGAAAHPTYYGSLPSTLFASPGTAVDASVLWVTAAQLQALTVTEFTYFFGRLDGVQFVPDEPQIEPLDRVFAYVSRLGTHTVDGAPVALAAIRARGRTASALTQEQLLASLAPVAVGAGAGAREVVAAIMADFPGVAARLRPHLLPAAQPFASDRWTRYPT